MKAIVQNAYGPPELLELKDVAVPEPKKGEVLVRVRAAALHAGDYFIMLGVPYLARFYAGWPRPKDYIPGLDVAGIVEAVGEGVTRLQPGDEVFGAGKGACAEFVAVPEHHLVPKPGSLSFEQAAAIPTSGLAALHGLRDAAGVRPGHQVLIIGAAGGVGTFAVQIARELGAEVTGVCSTANVDLVRSLGAGHVVDYTKEDFTQGEQRYDVILDNVADRPFAESRRALAPGGVLIPNSGHAGLGHVLKAYLRSIFVRQQGRPYLSSPNHGDLVYLKELVESAKLAPVIGHTYPLERAPEALSLIGGRHARGKVVITAAQAAG